MTSCREQASASASASSSSFPFLRLPLEIQHQVCSLFCRHCRGKPSSPSVTLSEIAGVSFATLKALSETCGALKGIAQPILYHFPDVKTYTPFFKTVTARPDLAARVKVLATIYESGWDWVAPGPPRHEKEDFAYLIKLAQSLGLNDDADGCVDHWAADDANFKRCFKYLEDTSDGDQIGYTMDMAQQSYFCLLTALQFAILPKLEFAAIDLYDGMAGFGPTVLNSGQLQLPYPYLPQAVAAYPEHFSHIGIVVFRNLYHYRHDRLGLERISFLFPAIPNVRAAFLELIEGEKPRPYQEARRLYAAAELGWPALPHLEELYFGPCARKDEPAPLAAVSEMVQRCSRLKKFVYRQKYPGRNSSPDFFSPAQLLNAVLPAKETLLRLEMYCSSAKIPSFLSVERLVDFRLKEFVLLTTLVLDEELFCQHWLLSDMKSGHNACLVNVLPEKVSSLTIRLHDKFKAVPDLLRVGQEVASGRYPRLSHLQVYVLRDVAGPLDPFNFDEQLDVFDSEEYLLHAVEPEQWEGAVKALADTIRPTVMQAFDGTNVTAKVEYLYEVTVSEEMRL